MHQHASTIGINQNLLTVATQHTGKVGLNSHRVPQQGPMPDAPALHKDMHQLQPVGAAAAITESSVITLSAHREW
jgi:hypothetical protein